MPPVEPTIPVYECTESDGIRFIGDIVEHTTVAAWKRRIANDRPGLHHELSPDEDVAYIVRILDARPEGD